MDYITVPQFKKIQARQKYKYLQLVDLNGAVIVALNSKVATVEDRMREIETRVPIQKDNVFVLKCKNSLSKNAKIDEYRIVRDITLAESEPEIIHIQEAPQKKDVRQEVEGVNVRSYEAVLKLEIENKRLELEVERQEEKIQLLQEQLSEQIELAEENPNTSMIEGAQAWLSSTLEMVAPMFDKHFELKEKKINLETVKLQHLIGNGQQRQQPPQEKQAEPLDPNAVNYVDDKIKSYVLALNEKNEESAEKIKEIYNSAQSMDDFYNGVKEYNEDIFNELLNYINNG